MPTQSSVVSAFLNGDTEPSQASNFHMEVLDDGYTAALIGDRRAVFAVREPVRSFTLYNNLVGPSRDRDWTQHIFNDALRNQQRLVQRRLRRSLDEESVSFTIEHARPPEPEDTRFNVDG